MLDNLLHQILGFFSVLLLTMSVLAYLFVWKYPLRWVWWKRSDYLYFISAIGGAALALVGHTSSKLHSDVVTLRLEQINLDNVIRPTLDAFIERCKRQESDKRIEKEIAEQREQRERERREGILRPDRPLGQPWFFDKDSWEDYYPRQYFAELSVSDAECSYIDNALPKEDHSLQPSLLEKMAWHEAGSMPSDQSILTSAIDHCAPYEFRRSSNAYSQYNTRLTEPSERIATICEEIQSATEHLRYLRGVDPIEGLWPMLLGFAFGVRLSRVHAEVNEVLSKEGRPLRTALIAKRIAMVYSQIRQRLRLRPTATHLSPAKNITGQDPAGRTENERPAADLHADEGR